MSQHDIDTPTYMLRKPPKKIGSVSGNEIGADRNRYEYDEMTSKFRTNTVENSQMFDGAREQLKDDGFKYRKVSERESVETARQRLQVDYRGGEENLFKKEVFDGSDTMLDRLISLKTGKRTTTGLSLDKLKAQARGAKQCLGEWASDILASADEYGIGKWYKVDTSPSRTKYEMAPGESFKNKGIGKPLNFLEGTVRKLLQLDDRPFYQSAYNSRICDTVRCYSACRGYDDTILSYKEKRQGLF